MLLHSIEIHNFKSIGESNNLIIIEPRITTIIGKNESGKSNILESIFVLALTKSYMNVKDKYLIKNGVKKLLKDHKAIKKV